MNKQEFRDSLRLRYNMPLSDLPSKCVGGEKYVYRLPCLVMQKGRIVAQRHDGIRNLLTSLISKVCTNVEVERVSIYSIEGGGYKVFDSHAKVKQWKTFSVFA